LQQLGAPLQVQGVPVEWKAPLSGLPASATAYRVVSGKFSPLVLSNLLTMATLTQKDRTRPSWDGARNDDLSFRDAAGVRFLDIIPDEGHVVMRNTKAIASPHEVIEGVPDETQAVQLAEAMLPSIGLDTRQLARRTGSDDPLHTRGVDRRNYFDKTQGKRVTAVIARQIFFIRSFDGIPSIGLGGAGGIWFSFGNHGELAELRLVWRTVEPQGGYSVAKASQFIDWIQAGKCVCDSDFPEQPRTIVITNLVPYYLELRGGEPQREIHPVAQLEAEAKLAHTNLPIRVYCPLLMYH
jgi:hypothetical protein